MIVDKMTNLTKYPQLAPYAEDMLAFLKTLTPETAEGKYDLQGDKLFALVQRYTSRPKEGALMESHKVYADLQYIVSGKEYIYTDFTDELVACDDRTPAADIVFYEVRPDKGGNLLEAGMFGYYAPQDAHMPCIMVNGPEAVEKVVFKIKLNK